jgi:hypothetical protein
MLPLLKADVRQAAESAGRAPEPGEIEAILRQREPGRRRALGEYQAGLIDFLQTDERRAAEGNQSNPVKAATDTLRDMRDVLLACAKRYRTAVVPAYTNGVQTQPATFGHLLLGYEATLQRSADQLAQAYPRLNTCPLGPAALATSSFPIDRVRLAELLGFGKPAQNSFDAARLSLIDISFEVASAALALSIGTFIQNVHAQYHHTQPWITLDSTDLLSPSTLMPCGPEPGPATGRRGDRQRGVHRAGGAQRLLRADGLQASPGTAHPRAAHRGERHRRRPAPIHLT